MWSLLFKIHMARVLNKMFFHDNPIHADLPNREYYIKILCVLVSCFFFSVTPTSSRWNWRQIHETMKHNMLHVM